MSCRRQRTERDTELSINRSDNHRNIQKSAIIASCRTNQQRSKLISWYTRRNSGWFANAHETLSGKNRR